MEPNAVIVWRYGARIVAIIASVAFGSLSTAAASEVLTLAGSGAPGIADGRGSQASFLLPYGIAVGSKGVIYVSDYSAQRIRAIDKDGNVRTVAGGGDMLPGALQVRGGYADGADALARFNGPAGIAVDRYGRIYVADSRNHCIRVIRFGRVRTLAGSPKRRGGDGTLKTAGFYEPRALAFDALGNLWVGDGLNGLRRITPGGVVSTVRLPRMTAERRVPFGTHITSIAADKGGLHIADGFSILDFNPLFPRTYSYTVPDIIGEVIPKNVEHAAGRTPAGYPFALASLDIHTLVYTDPVMHALRLRKTALNVPLTRIPAENDDLFGGGFADGQAAVVDAPLGIAARGGHEVVFADAGNRRIRIISEIETRHFAEPDLMVDPFGAFRDGHKYYRILFIGNSYAAYSVPFGETAAGQIESLLNANRPALGLTRPAKLAIVWLATASAVRDYVRNVITSRFADAVIWEFNGVLANDDVGRPDVLGPPITIAPALRALSPKVREIHVRLQRERIPLYVAIQPSAYDFPPLEQTALRMAYVDTPEDSAYVGSEQFFAQLFEAEGVVPIDLWPDFALAEASAERHPLFSSRDYHLTSFGQAVVGNAVYRGLASAHPWITK